MRKIIVVVFCFILSFFFCNRIYCQSDKYDNNLTVVSDVTKEQQEKFEDLLLKKDISRRIKNASFWLAYKAFRNNDASICFSAVGYNGENDCLDRVDVFEALKILANGDCSNLPNSHANSVDACQAIKAKNCAALSGFKRKQCMGLR